MTDEDDTSLTEDELAEIADRVADRLTGDTPKTGQETGDARDPDDGDDGPTVKVIRSADHGDADAESDDHTPGPTPSLGETIERSVEETMAAVEADIERALDSIPTGDSVVFDPTDSDRKSVYKTQLQKGGRIAVPDPEIEALGLDPGDTLQVVVYPVDRD